MTFIPKMVYGENRSLNRMEIKMTKYEELTAMKQIADALEPLDEAARARALHWAFSSFGGAPNAKQTFGMGGNTRPGIANDSAADSETFAELFEAASPTTEREKGLVAAYWVQVCQGQPSFGSQPLNDALKDLGHGVGNITDALSALKDERPALLLQLKKSGTSKQARKTYKLTQEGIRRVQNMMAGQAAAAE